MITGPKRVLGVPAAQQQMRDRKRRRRNQQQDNDSTESDSENKRRKQPGAAVVRTRQRPDLTGEGPGKAWPTTRRGHSPRRRQRRQVDIRV